MNLTYTLGEHGWAFIDAEFRENRIRFEVSYMSHALDDLVSATIASLSGRPVVRFALIDEPGSYCWVLTRKADLLQIKIVHIESMYAVQKFNQEMLVIESSTTHGLEPDTSPPEAVGQFVASVECPAIGFGTVVARMLEQIRGQYTPNDFTRSRNKPVSPELEMELAKLLELRERA